MPVSLRLVAPPMLCAEWFALSSAAASPYGYFITVEEAFTFTGRAPEWREGETGCRWSAYIRVFMAGGDA